MHFRCMVPHVTRESQDNIDLKLLVRCVALASCESFALFAALFPFPRTFPPPLPLYFLFFKKLFLVFSFQMYFNVYLL